MSTPFDGVVQWAAERGQSVTITDRAMSTILVLRDPRLGPPPKWDFDDVALALLLKRRTLPWLPEVAA